jgi:hypothetical protein
MDYFTFARRREAVAYIRDHLLGWDARPVRMQIVRPDGSVGPGWVIACRVGTGDPQYLRTDGYVR